jgi:Flp pilus assembly protein TadB
MRRYESLRASDADRDAVTDRLREAAGEGRLEPEELEQRVDAALRARTYGELGRLVADLPGGREVPWRRQSRRPARPVLVATGLVAAATLAVAAVALAVLVVLAVAALAAVWWIVCIIFWAVLCRSRRRLGPGPAWRHRTRVHRARPTGLL